MPTLKLKIDVGGTTGDEAWRAIQQFDPIQGAYFGPEFGGSKCKHTAGAPHVPGEWIGAAVKVGDPLLSQYAVSHYLEQPRVLDVDVEP
jgi:hypothetical protein